MIREPDILGAQILIVDKETDVWLLELSYPAYLSEVLEEIKQQSRALWI